MHSNPVIWADYPDVDVIRVGDVYYMISTTMHFFPGGVILRSWDLVHWETAAHVYDALDHTPAQRMEDGAIYSKGMWAATLRYHDGVFHVVFVANDTHKSYHFTANAVEGPWTSHPMEGFYHDSSLLFDNGRVYIAYGGREIRLTELEDDLSRPKPGGLDRVIVRDEVYGLGYEGSHLYKINGKYVLTLIHWPAGHMRTEAVFTADSLDGEWTGGDVLEDDMGFHRQGVAQGGLVDTPDGDWYAMLFQDHGAVGRIPVLVPVTWENGAPRFASPPHAVEVPSTRPDYSCRPLYVSDDFVSGTLFPEWEWNHEPDLPLVGFGGGSLNIRTGRCDPDAEHAKNTLTMRTFGPGCAAQVTVDGSGLRDGDTAGIVALQGLFAEAGILREGDAFFAVMREKTDEGFFERAKLPLDGQALTLRAVFDFRDLADRVWFEIRKDGDWHPLGGVHRLVYRLDHFTGVRIGLFCFASRESGGEASFTAFRYSVDEE
ncbi:MAG: family 43 glycosylhydrolase [Clostridia bacterium]|nr:family 43 glycosylhydrolase [Clostridia bacterium]